MVFNSDLYNVEKY